YETLTGRAAFARETITDTLAAIIERDPDWAALPSATPPAIVRLLRRCLEKDPSRRLHDVADVRIEIDDAVPDRLAAPPAFAQSKSATPSVLERIGVNALGENREEPNTARRTPLLVFGIGILVLIVGVIGYSWWKQTRSSSQPEIKSLAVLPLKSLDAGDNYL